MKKALTLLFILTIVLIIPGRAKADTVYVNVINDFFSPANFTCEVGDYIKWTLVEGVHTTTSNVIPAGAASWDYTFLSVGDTFVYEVTVPGVYNYECLFHPGMDGMFTAEVGGFPFVEDFDYPEGDSLANHSWSIHSGGTTNAILVTAPGLTYPDYPSSGIGNAATLTTSGQDVNRQFEPVTSGAIYAAVMVNVASAQGGDYFFHLGLANTTSIFMGRVYVKLAANSNLAFGLSKTSIGGALNIQPVYSDSIYNTGTTYLLVLKYAFHPGVDDDTLSLFINPAITPVEPAPDLVHAESNANDPANIGGVYLRQGSAGIASNVTVDGIRISSTWIETVVPVELVSFNASVSGSSVSLNWITASEINNLGFDVERKLSSASWEKIGFVQGYGTTTESRHYSYTDNNLPAGKYSYRLKQIDFDGSFTYSKEVEVDINTIYDFNLSQNYPNPFNPATTITFSLPDAQHVTIKVYNALGQEVAALVNGVKEAGVHTINFNASGLNSGVYFYRIDATPAGGQAGSFSQVKKMTLIK